MSGAHAKPLTRRQHWRRARISKWTAGMMGAALLAGAATCALTMPGTPTALGVPDRSPTPPSPAVWTGQPYPVMPPVRRWLTE